MKRFVRNVVDRLVQGSIRRAGLSQDEGLIIARDLVLLRRRVTIAESLSPARVEEIRKIAIDAAVAIRALRVDLEAEGTQASARFAYVRQEIARYREEGGRAAELLSENAERAGDALHSFRDLAASALASYETRFDAVVARLTARAEELGARAADIDALDARIEAVEAKQISADDAVRSRPDAAAVSAFTEAHELDVLRAVTTARESLEAAARFEASIAAVSGRLEALELVSFPLPGAMPDDRVDRIEAEAVRALERIEQLRHALAWRPEYAVPAFDGAVTGNGTAGKRAMVERFGRTFSVGDHEEREAARLVVGASGRVLTIAEEDVGWGAGFTRVAADDQSVVQAVGEAQRGAYDAIVALTYPERCDVEQRFALLRGAVHALGDEGVLVLGITNGYALEGWRRFHLDPWNTHPWMPDTWRFALASTGFRGARFYDPIRREYVSDVAAANARLLVVADR